jgi:hypothetical protein
MRSEIVVALLSLVGTFIGTLGGILATQKLVTYRLQKLEEKVDKHNNLIDRMYKIETRVTLLEDEMKAR